MPCTDAQGLAQASVADGLSSHLAKSLAKAGCSGKHRQNIKRDVISHARKHGRQGLPPTARVPASFHTVDLASGEVKVKQMMVSMMLPHEMLFALYTFFQQLFYDVFIVPGEVTHEYWHGVQHEPWFLGLPSATRTSISSNPSKWIPLRLHGDDHPVRKTHSAVSINFTSPLSWDRSTNITCVFPIFFLLMKHLTSTTVQELLQEVVWSFH